MHLPCDGVTADITPAVRPTPRTPVHGTVLFIFGYQDDQTRRLDPLDDYQYLQKPFTLGELLAAVRAAFIDDE